MSALSEKSAFEAFARMEEKIEQNERQIRASSEIDEEFSGDRLANDFRRLERSAGSGNAESQLLALKQKMGVLPAPTAGSNQLAAGQGGNAAPRQLGAGQGANQPAGQPADEELLAAEIDELPEEKKAR
jgi:phage shock protein A